MPKGVKVEIIGANKIGLGTLFIDVYVSDNTNNTVQIRKTN